MVGVLMIIAGVPLDAVGTISTLAIVAIIFVVSMFLMLVIVLTIDVRAHK